MATALKEIEPQEIEARQKNGTAETKEEEYDDSRLPFDYGYDDEGYLVSDGQPMAEHDIHRKQMTNSIESLEAHFSGQIAYVSGNNFLHYIEGNRATKLSPDCYVVFGVPQAIRENYKSWQHEDRMPAIVIEFTSKKTRKVDEGKKFRIYEQTLRVPEYIQFDPRADYIPVRLRGYRLNASGQYEPIAFETDGRMYSETLDLYLETRGNTLRLFDAKTGEYLRTPAESETERLEEKQRADREARERRRIAQALETSEQERRQTEMRANEETQRAFEAEARNAELLAELEALRRERNG